MSPVKGEPGYSYELRTSPPDSSGYRLHVYCDETGRFVCIGNGYPDTRWGGRRLARKIAKKHRLFGPGGEVVDSGSVAP